uniref:Uncharacterized protein n=1 Tax=Phaeodactylum tricornutum TaxID=2850 RepID=A0A8J9X243_PHATR
MNTMVGMQASLHQTISEDVSNRMQQNDDSCHHVGQNEANNMLDDDFDPDELLKSPLFNDSGKDFAKILMDDDEFAINSDDGAAVDHYDQIDPKDFGGLYFSTPAEVSVQTSSTSESSYLYPKSMKFVNTHSDNSFSQQVLEPNLVDLSLDHHSEQGMYSLDESSFSDDSIGRTSSGQSLPQACIKGQPNHLQTLPDRCLSMEPPSKTENMNPMQHLLPQDIQCPRTASFSTSAATHHIHQKQQQVCNTGMPMGSIVPLNHLQQMRQTQGTHFGLSQSMHGASQSHMINMSGQRTKAHRESLSGGSFHGVSLHGGSLHGTAGNPSYFHGNISIASNIQGIKSPSQMYGSSSKNPATLNEAMEKLCDSMKRSAMSRSMVKQYSGRNIGRQNSSRQLMQRQGSNRSLLDDGSGRGVNGPAVPLRRMSNTKHQVHHPGRGVHRHDSQQSLNGHSNHSISVQFDGRNTGGF